MENKNVENVILEEAKVLDQMLNREGLKYDGKKEKLRMKNQYERLNDDMRQTLIAHVEALDEKLGEYLLSIEKISPEMNELRDKLTYIWTTLDTALNPFEDKYYGETDETILAGIPVKERDGFKDMDDEYKQTEAEYKKINKAITALQNTNEFPFDLFEFRMGKIFSEKPEIIIKGEKGRKSIWLVTGYLGRQEIVEAYDNESKRSVIIDTKNPKKSAKAIISYLALNESKEN